MENNNEMENKDIENIEIGSFILYNWQEEKKYTKEDLISFGNYLLSKERDKTILDENNKDKVTDADIKNWEAKI